MARSWFLTPRSSYAEKRGLRVPLKGLDGLFVVRADDGLWLQLQDGHAFSAAVPMSALLDAVTLDGFPQYTWRPTTSEVNGVPTDTVLVAIRETLHLGEHEVGEGPSSVGPATLLQDATHVPPFELNYPAWGISLSHLRVRHSGTSHSYAIPADNWARHPLIQASRMGVHDTNERIGRVLAQLRLMR